MTRVVSVKCLWDVVSLDSHGIRLWRQPLENSCLLSFLVVNTSIAPNISVQYPVTVPVQSSATLSADILSTEGVIIINNTQPYDGNSVQLAKAACCGGLLTHFIFPNTILNPTHLQYYSSLIPLLALFLWIHRVWLVKMLSRMMQANGQISIILQMITPYFGNILFK